MFRTTKQRWRKWRDERMQMSMLEDLDDHLLKDIDLHRDKDVGLAKLPRSF